MNNRQAHPFDCLTLGIHESFFTGLDPDDSKKFKQEITDIFLGKSPGQPKEIAMKCELLASFIMLYTASDLPDTEKDAATNAIFQTAYGSGGYARFRLLPFFAWAAMNDRVDLLRTPCLKLLFQRFPEAARASLPIAAVFDSKNYLYSAISELETSVFRQLMSIAIALKDNDMLAQLANIAAKRGLTVKEIVDDAARSDTLYCDLAGIGKRGPLCWALRCDNTEATKYLLEHGINPNNDKDDFSGESLLY